MKIDISKVSRFVKINIQVVQDLNQSTKVFLTG